MDEGRTDFGAINTINWRYKYSIGSVVQESAYHSSQKQAIQLISPWIVHLRTCIATLSHRYEHCSAPQAGVPLLVQASASEPLVQHLNRHRRSRSAISRVNCMKVPDSAWSVSGNSKGGWHRDSSSPPASHI